MTAKSFFIPLYPKEFLISSPSFLLLLLLERARTDRQALRKKTSYGETESYLDLSN